MSAVTFDAELRAYLERLTAPSGGAPLRPIDESKLRAHLLRRLRQWEATDPESSAAAFRRWSPELTRLARYLSSLPPSIAPLDADAAQAFAHRVLEVALGLKLDAIGGVERLELERVVAAYRASGTQILETYALEASLVRQDAPQQLELSALGTAFLRLRGKAAVRWLLSVELVQSRGAFDPWRAPRELLEAALNEIKASVAPNGEPGFPFEARTLERLCEMGAVTRRWGHDSDYNDVILGYAVAPGWRETVRGALDASVWHSAIAAIAGEDRTGVAHARVPASESVAEQTKAIAHEIRNALIPARHHIDALLEDKLVENPRRLEGARAGIARVLRFVEEMLDTSELVAEALKVCELAVVAQRALGSVDGGELVSLVAGPAVRAYAKRSQLTRAIANVVRNALQAAAGAAPVRLTIVDAGPVARIEIDDGGPGVPPEIRDRVFQEGFTTRGEGTGYGLAYVRRVISDELHGKVWCETSPDLGGARFVIELSTVPSPR